jgi:hypothetical protein
MNREQFGRLMFSTHELVNEMVKYLYRNSVYPNGSMSYLMQNHSGFCGLLNGLSTGKVFSGMGYQVESSDGLVPDDGNFSSVRGLVGNRQSL